MNRWVTAIVAVAAYIAVDAQARTIAQFRTILGDIEVELFTEEKPVTCANFIRLVEAGAYRNTFFHRLEPGFVIQGGGYFVTNALSTNLFTQPIAVPSFGPITNEYDIGPQISNLYGTIAMAKSPTNVHSATCQWFFNLADNATNPPGFLDTQNGGFTVFGRVVRGTNILNTFNTLAYTNGIVDLTAFYGPGAAAFGHLPVLYVGWAPPRYVDLLYVGISLMKLSSVVLTDGVTRVSWKSAGNMTNVIETSPAVSPPAWTTLHTTNGTGNTMSIVDTNSATGTRFYRVLALP